MHIKDIGNSEHKQDTVFPYSCSRAIRTEKKMCSCITGDQDCNDNFAGHCV